MVDSLGICKYFVEFILNNIGITFYLGIYLLKDLLNFIFSQIKIEDILTAFAIIISALTLASSLSKDRSLRKKERADKIRNSAASTLVKLDRWVELSMSIFQDVQPIFLDEIMSMSKNFDPETSKNVLWMKMTEANNEVTWKILGENIQTASIELMGYRPDIRNPFMSAFKKMNSAREKMFENFVNDMQKDVLSFKGSRKEEYKPNDLWDKLNGSIMRNEWRFEKSIEPILDDIKGRLLDLICMDDVKILGE